MIYARSVESMKERFGPRLPEWALGTIILVSGFVLMSSAPVFDAKWIVFQSIMDQWHWGQFFAILGFARLGGLAVNGARKEVTPWIRMISAGLGFFLFLGMSIAFYGSGVAGLWIAIYPTFTVLEILNFHRAGYDVGSSTHAVARNRSSDRRA